MKGKRTFATMLALGLMLALMAGLGMAQEPASPGIAAPQAPVGTAFTYQGKLNDGGSPANGSYDFEFGLYDVASGGTALDTVNRSDVAVADGLFTVQLDFGGDAFTGDARWLEIRLRAGDAGPYTSLVPRQPLTPAPYALSLRPGATIHNTTGSWFEAALRLSSDDGIGLTVGPVGYDGLFLYGAVANGVTVSDVGGHGVEVDSVGQDGVHVSSAVHDGVHVTSAGWDGVAVDSAVASGLYVASAGGDGLNVNQAGDDGVYVYRAGNPSNAFPQTGKNGFEVAGAEAVGLQVGRADIYGVWVNSAGYTGIGVTAAGTDGMYVYQAGNPSTRTSSSANDGFEVTGAQGNGLFVGRADSNGVRVASAGGDGVAVDSASWSGLYVASAGGDGVNVNTAGDDGVYVHQAGSPSRSVVSSAKNGFEVAGAQGNGLYIGQADGTGVLVDWASEYGVAVITAAGVGAYANTTQANNEWGFYTPDKIFAGVTLASGGPLMLVAQSGDQGNLETGDVVAVSGVGAVFADGEAPAPLVQQAGPGSSILGVVYSHFVAEEQAREVEHDGQTEQQTSLHAHSTEGPIAPGGYLLVVVMGAAQVKAEALSGGIVPGDLLAVSAAGLATNAAPARIDGLAYYPPGSIVGTAMEPLDGSRGSGLIWVLVSPR